MRKEEFLAELMRVRGAGASRFKPGRSGNPKGRPRRKPSALPYDGFFMGTVRVAVNGKKQRMTRVDALMTKVLDMAVNGDLRIRRFVLPKLMKLHEMRWDEQQDRPVVQQFIRM